MKKKMNQLCSFCFLFACAMLLFGLNANAYIDPSVMTYMIQVVAGLVVAVGAVAGVLFRRAKRKIAEKFGIDENRNKEVESDEIITDIDDE